MSVGQLELILAPDDPLIAELRQILADIGDEWRGSGRRVSQAAGRLNFRPAL
ncbi:MAG TPA: hypothetical protein VH089_29045 [Streptosporangiaceae bacterium]|nr:hypothetical protein [Streptosporangiaceae bacterium]